MHVHLGTALVIVALVSSIVLLLQSERTVSLVAVIASGLEALLVFGLMSLSVAKFRVDVILPALLAIAGVISWARASTKHVITAATLVSCVGVLQLLGALGIVG
jgi:hypothetical protein